VEAREIFGASGMDSHGKEIEKHFHIYTQTSVLVLKQHSKDILFLIIFT